MGRYQRLKDEPMTAGDGTKDCDRAHKQQKEWAHSISPNVASGFSFAHLSSQGRVRHYPYDQLTAGAMPAGAARARRLSATVGGPALAG